MTTSLPVFRFKHEPDTNSPKEWLNTIKAAKKESNDYKTLLRLYHRAAVLITPEEHEKDPAYAQLLVEFAQLQSLSTSLGYTSVPDARRQFFCLCSDRRTLLTGCSGC
ncbi:predicted protein [Nematostella vectensis]|uniref:Uncharacterized protein n=1 Tax=Nematostella vectensis TaxID=45351 RepID=A7SKB8_NEMVE|nr:predicted protein [Nematostella vectensis]|eukprot:XP_001627894.1 predicted protein [Nematostella vectensis]